MITVQFTSDELTELRDMMEDISIGDKDFVSYTSSQEIALDLKEKLEKLPAFVDNEDYPHFKDTEE